MPLLHLPDVPPDEIHSFKQRILKKYEAFLAKQAAGGSNALQDQGERYEIAVALYLYRNHLVNNPRFLSRWLLPGETGSQSIYMGINNEYDFLVADTRGILLGDAKSESSGLGGYLKKAISFCLLDHLVRSHENQLAGFCFATPSDPAGMVRTALRNSWEILTTLSDCAGITGMNSQLIPADIKVYFRGRYLAKNQIVRMETLAQSPEYYVRELQEKAGFTFQFLQVAPMTQPELARQMELLVAKARWAAP